jgi:hypothetical protein
LSIAALGIAVVYLLLLLTGAIAALLVLVWLFRDAPGVDRRPKKSETFRDLRDVERFMSRRTCSAQVEESERPRDKAA